MTGTLEAHKRLEEAHKRLEEAHERLKDNAIYALSLGSRELFHSNFLAWMFEKYPQMIGVLIEGCKPEDGFKPEDVEVEREKYNLDLLVRFKSGGASQAIVVEVKVKDAPRPDQLMKYDATIENHVTGDLVNKILLSLVTPPENSTWQYLSCLSLGKNIRDFLSKIEAFNEDRVIIKGYADLCCDLGKLVSEVGKIDQATRDYFYPKPGKEKIAKDVDVILSKVRFLDTISKHRASKLRDEIESEFKHRYVESNFHLNGIEPAFYVGFDQKVAHVVCSLKLKLGDPQGDTRDLDLDILIQGWQYRRVLSFDGFPVQSRKQGKNRQDMDSFIESTDRWNWMFGRTHANGYFENSVGQDGFFEGKVKVPTSQQKSKQLCSYAPKHIYQYTTIGYGDVGVRTSDLVNAVIKDLHYASTLLADPKYVGRFKEWRQLPR